MFASFCLYTRPVGRRQTTTHWRASSPYGAGPGPESSQYRRNLCSLSLIHHVSVRWRAPWRRTLIKRKRAHFQNEFSHIRGRPPCFTPKWKMYSGQWTIHCLNPHQPCAMSPGLQSERNLSITPKWCRGSFLNLSNCIQYMNLAPRARAREHKHRYQTPKIIN